MVGENLLLNWFHKELRHLGGSQLVPGQGRLASSDNQNTYGVGGRVGG